ncbi:MAG: hypothetical protein JWP10_831, partial [Nocardioidaceae bacterium]|nr:hypothetical protein [Nocardioidaceae bacterium]
PNGPSCVSTMRVKSNEKLTFISFQVSKTKECLGTPKKVGVNVKTINTGKFGKKAYKKPKVDYYPKKNTFTKRIKQS